MSSLGAQSVFDVAWLLANPGQEPARRDVRITLDGARIGAVQTLPQSPEGARRLALPALANAHDHARTFRSATLGAFGRPLEAWLPYLGVIPGADPYLCAATSFARSVRGGVAQLMVHYTRVQGGCPYVDEVQAVARAARDVGVRIGFAVALRDRNGIGLCDDAVMLAALRPEIRQPVAERLSVRPVSVAEQLAQVEEVARMLAADQSLSDHVTLQYGPTGVQWCSTPLLEAVAQASSERGRPVHMHLLETRYQREWADQHFPQGMLAHLDAIGLLSPRLTLAHCTWARPDELALLAERGVTIVVNTSSNLGLQSGIAPVAQMLREGCRVAIGIDGTALDEDDDALREMRLFHLLHRGWGFDVEMDRATLWRCAARHGRRSVSGARDDDGGGVVAAGAPADFLVLDWNALDDDALFADVDPLDLLLARARRGFIDQVVIGGRTVVQSGRLVTLDEPALRVELVAQVRRALADSPGFDSWRRTLDQFSEDLGPFYRNSAWSGCC